jgi:hypothetical protein
MVAIGERKEWRAENRLEHRRYGLQHVEDKRGSWCCPWQKRRYGQRDLPQGYAWTIADGDEGRALNRDIIPALVELLYTPSHRRGRTARAVPTLTTAPTIFTVSVWIATGPSKGQPSRQNLPDIDDSWRTGAGWKTAATVQFGENGLMGLNQLVHRHDLVQAIVRDLQSRQSSSPQQSR